MDNYLRHLAHHLRHCRQDSVAIPEVVVDIVDRILRAQYKTRSQRQLERTALRQHFRK